EADLGRLRLQRRLWKDEQFTYQITREHGRRLVEEARQRIDQAEQALARRIPTQGDAFTMEIGGTTYDERRAAGTVLLSRLDRFERGAVSNDRQHVADLGTLGGFGLQATMEWSVGGRYVSLHFPDAPVAPVPLDPRELRRQDPVGLVRKLENTLG